MSSMLNLNDPNSVSKVGLEIYDQLYRSDFEANQAGKFVAIDVTAESATVGATVDEALTRALSNHPQGFFHLIRIGHKAVFEVGLSDRHVTSDRLPRQ